MILNFEVLTFKDLKLVKYLYRSLSMDIAQNDDADPPRVHLDSTLDVMNTIINR